MEKAIPLRELNFCLEQGAQPRGRQKIVLRAIGDDTTVLHHQDPVDLGWNVRDMVSNQ
jgi:hypothetical protein